MLQLGFPKALVDILNAEETVLLIVDSIARRVDCNYKRCWEILHFCTVVYCTCDFPCCAYSLVYGFQAAHLGKEKHLTGGQGVIFRPVA